MELFASYFAVKSTDIFTVCTGILLIQGGKNKLLKMYTQKEINSKLTNTLVILSLKTCVFEDKLTKF